MTRYFVLLLAIGLVATSLGCSTTGGSHWMSKPDFSAWKPAGPPSKAVAVWDPAIRHDTDGEKATRGFGGRVYFYDEEAKKPVKIDGSVIVYAFDEKGRKAEDVEPTRTYYFDKKDVKKLYSKSKLGHSYNFWVPWDTDGPEGEVKKVSLIVRYVPDVGSSVVSTQAKVYLPGKAGQDEMMAKAEWDKKHRSDGSVVENGIRQVGYLENEQTVKVHGGGPAPAEKLIETNGGRPLSMQTATISLPTNLTQSMQTALTRPAPVQAPIYPPVASEIQQAGFVQSPPNTAQTIPPEAKTTDPGTLAREALKRPR